MPLQGEQAWMGWAYTTGGSLYTATWDLNFAPSPKFIKVFLVQVFSFGDDVVAEAGLVRIRYRLPDNSDATINFPDIDNFNSVPVQFNNTMTHVRFGIKVREGYGQLVWTLGYW